MNGSDSNGPFTHRELRQMSAAILQMQKDINNLKIDVAKLATQVNTTVNVQKEGDDRRGFTIALIASILAGAAVIVSSILATFMGG